MKLSLMFFSCSLKHEDPERYELLLRAARFADQHGFEAVWLPERHFSEIGYLYPAPAVLHAALARETSRIALRAGSVVLPINDPIRVAEQWAVVDNLSGGRVGISFAPGWNPADFALAPQAYEKRYEILQRGIDEVRRLWRGETVARLDGIGKPVELRLLPPPVQARLPVWMTSAGSEGSIRSAAGLDANLLTHLFDQGVAELSRKILLYREARAAAGFEPALGTVTVMAHTFVGMDEARVRSEARGPYCEFLASNIKILEGLAASRGKSLSVDSLGPREAYEFAEFIYDRFCRERALIGSVGGCAEMVRALADAGVDELACLIDFGIPTPRVLESLEALGRLRELVEKGGVSSPSAELPGGLQLPPDARPVDAAHFYADAERYGASYGASFRAIERAWVGKSAALASVALAPDLSEDESSYRVHPALLDNAFLLSSALTQEHGSGVALPAGVDRFVVHRAHPGRRLFVSAHARPATRAEWALADVDIFDASGCLVAEARGLRFQLLRRASERVNFDPAICFSEQWVELQTSAGAGSAGDAVIIEDRRDVASHVARALSATGWNVRHARADDAVGLAAALAGLASRPGGVIINLTPLDARRDLFEGGDAFATRDASFRQVELLRSLLEVAPDSMVRCYFVTRGAMCTAAGDAANATQAAIGALVRAAGAEHPRLGFAVIDLEESAGPEVDGAAIARVVAAAREEPAVCVRAGRELAAQLRPVQSLPRVRSFERLDPLATYLLVGGAGGLGLALAREMIARGAKRLVLTGRRAVEDRPDRKAGLEELGRQGADIQFVVNDLTKPGAGQALLEELDALPGRLAGVVHLATVIEPAMVERITHVGWHRALAAKVDGAHQLHEAVIDRELDFFALVSAIPAKVPWTAVGAGAYAAANAALDALVQLRRQRGLPATGINFGPWASLGAAAELFGNGETLTRQGLGSLKPSEALEAFFELLSTDAPAMVVARCEWQRMADLHPAAAASSLLSALVKSTVASEVDLRLGALQSCAPSERLGYLRDYLAQLVAEVLECPVERIDVTRSLNTYGLDSLTALEARNRMERRLGVAIPLVTFLEGPSIEQLATRLLPGLKLEVGADRQIEEMVL